MGIDGMCKRGGPPRVASLCNLGNTCFLNSVLYTLRFTPGFSHSLHHLIGDLGLSSSSSSTSSASSSKKSSPPPHCHYPEYEVIERLHDLFRALKSADEGDVREPVPPSSFLQSVGKLNPMFEGNRQQDAHELLVTILNVLQDIKIPLSDKVAPSNGVSKIDLDAAASSAHSNHSSSSSKKSHKKWKSSSSSLATPSVIGSKAQDGCINSQAIPNFVKENFIGKSVMSTRCLECEMSTHRNEPFTNIDIALQFDDDDEDLVGKELFLKKIMASETLRENNKYWCEECSRLNEAQRSVTYQLLPRILVLQLKRFTATGSKTYLSKINDYIPTPFSMDCFCTKCEDKNNLEPKHHYRLYAVIMHLGGTLASGHYIAYVRASDHGVEYAECQRGNSVERKNIRNSNKKGIMKYFSRSNQMEKSGNCSNHNSMPSSSINGSNGTLGNTCRSYSCCGLKSLILESKELGCSNESLSCGGDTSVPEDFWLECDDENIAIISRKQFEEILSSKQGATTPYLLFYQKY